MKKIIDAIIEFLILLGIASLIAAGLKIIIIIAMYFIAWIGS